MPKKKSLEEIVIGERKFVKVCDLAKTIAVCCVVAFLGSRVVSLMRDALTAKPECLDSFAKCFSDWNIPEVLSTLVIVIFGGAWYMEHKRNNKLVKSNGELRHKIESEDKVSTRSGLDSMGRTPKE